MSAHHPTLARTGRHGSWCVCVCGWQSRTFTTVTGAHLAFGAHLLNSPRPAGPYGAVPLRGGPVPKFTPARDDGLFPYVVERRQFGRSTYSVVYAASLKDARRQHGWTRELYVSLHLRRATPADMEAHAR